ncbi:MAG: GNAT family N-acetyltransferase [Bacteroidia bacterium]
MTARISLEPLDRYNWELCLDLQLAPGQETYVPGVLYSLAQARFENLVPYGVRDGEQMVGFVMYGEFGGICWISRVLIDRAHQRRGVGRAAVQLLLRQLRLRPACREIRTSYARENTAAGAFFRSLGFTDILPDVLDEEIVLRYTGGG